MGQTQSIAAQATMLPGLQFALQTALDNLNDARLALKMKPLYVSNADDLKQNAEQLTDPPRHAARPKKRKMSAEAKDKLRAATQERWDLVRKAGIKMAGRVPSAAEVDKARKLIARRSTTAKATKPARAVGARKKPAAAAATA